MEKGYSILEVAQLLRLRPRTVRQWIRDGRLKATKLAGSRRWIVLESEVRRVRGDDN